MAGLGSFAVDLIGALGGTPTPSAQKLFNSWQVWEGGHTKNAATWNPLNLTAPGSGLPTINAVGVVAIPSEQAGVQRTADLIRKGYPAIARAFATGQVDFNDPALQGDFNRWLSGKRTPGMSPYVSKIAQSFGANVPAGGGASSQGGRSLASPTPRPAGSSPTFDHMKLSNAIRDQIVAGGGRIDLTALPGLVRSSMGTVPVARPQGARPAPAPGARGPATPAAAGPFAPGSPILGGSHGGEHGTSGLAGYSGVDYFAPPGSAAVAPVSGKVVRFSGHDPKAGAVQGAGGPLGWSMYIQGDDGRTYYLTHMGSRSVKPGQRVKAGQPIGTVADYDKYGRPSHIHMGVR